MIDHIGLGVSDYARSKDFFLKALAPLGFGIVMLVCVLASTLAIRAALRVDPAAAIGG